MSCGPLDRQACRPTVDYNIFLEFTRNADGTVQGKLIGTDLEDVPRQSEADDQQGAARTSG